MRQIGNSRWPPSWILICIKLHHVQRCSNGHFRYPIGLKMWKMDATFIIPDLPKDTFSSFWESVVSIMQFAKLEKKLKFSFGEHIVHLHYYWHWWTSVLSKFFLVYKGSKLCLEILTKNLTLLPPLCCMWRDLPLLSFQVHVLTNIWILADMCCCDVQGKLSIKWLPAVSVHIGCCHLRSYIGIQHLYVLIRYRLQTNLLFT